MLLSTLCPPSWWTTELTFMHKPLSSPSTPPSPGQKAIASSHKPFVWTSSLPYIFLRPHHFQTSPLINYQLTSPMTRQISSQNSYFASLKLTDFNSYFTTYGASTPTYHSTQSPTAKWSPPSILPFSHMSNPPPRCCSASTHPLLYPLLAAPLGP